MKTRNVSSDRWAENHRLEKALELEKLRSKAFDTMINIAEECLGFGLSTLCRLFGYSRQSYYKRNDNDFAEDAIKPLIVEKVKDYREENPGLGCSKWHIKDRMVV